ncbi:MAG: hypothetical protein Q9190_007538 [Brigantiaea leucoxantha]
MQPRVQQIILVLVSILLTTVCADCSGCSKRDVSTRPWIGRRGLSLFKRDARKKCGVTQGVATLADRSVGGGYPSDYIPPKSRRDTLAKRSLAPFPESNDGTLTKRILVDFPTDKDAQDTFMVEQVEAAATDVVADPVQNGDEKDDINSAQFFQVGGTDYTKDPVTIGLGRKKDDDGNPIRLTGCTALIVMSEKAVYFAHFWETLSYDSTDEVFQKYVIDFINNGDTQNPDEQQALAAHADDFKGQPAASAWILYPVQDDVYEDDGSTTNVYYKYKNTKLQDEVFKLTGITATMTEYTPSDDGNTALGRALYQYDPNARAPDGDQPIRGFRFIHEYVNEGTHFY